MLIKCSVDIVKWIKYIKMLGGYYVFEFVFDAQEFSPIWSITLQKNCEVNVIDELASFLRCNINTIRVLPLYESSCAASEYLYHKLPQIVQLKGFSPIWILMLIQNTIFFTKAAAKICTAKWLSQNHIWKQKKKKENQSQ